MFLAHSAAGQFGSHARPFIAPCAQTDLSDTIVAIFCGRICMCIYMWHVWEPGYHDCFSSMCLYLLKFLRSFNYLFLHWLWFIAIGIESRFTARVRLRVLCACNRMRLIGMPHSWSVFRSVKKKKLKTKIKNKKTIKWEKWDQRRESIWFVCHGHLLYAPISSLFITNLSLFWRLRSAGDRARDGDVALLTGKHGILNCGQGIHWPMLWAVRVTDASPRTPTT